MRKVLGSKLKVGNMIKTWWSPHADVIVKLENYKGPLTNLFSKGAKIAYFASGMSMTCENDEKFEVFNGKL